MSTKAELEKQVASLERKNAKLEEKVAAAEAANPAPAGDPGRVHGPDAVPLEQR